MLKSLAIYGEETKVECSIILVVKLEMTGILSRNWKRNQINPIIGHRMIDFHSKKLHES